MKIGHLENSSVTPAVGERKSSAATTLPNASNAGAVEPSAKVQLSTTVAQLAAGGSEGVFDTAKVERISEAIRNGQFKVNPEAIADKLIANAQELLGNVGNR
jgi:negative regulator of flagellin synthesis FlgM